MAKHGRRPKLGMRPGPGSGPEPEGGAGPGRRPGPKIVRHISGPLLSRSLVEEVVVPETGEVVRLADARERMLLLNSWLGVKPKPMRKKLVALTEGFRRFASAVDAYNETGSLSSAAREAGVDRKSAWKWVTGKALPRAISTKNYEKYMKARKRLSLRPGGKADFAYVLGTMMGNASVYQVAPESKDASIKMTVNDLGFASAFRRALLRSTGISARIRHFTKEGRQYFAVELGSRSLLQLFNELTDYGNRIPSGFSYPNSPNRRFLVGAKGRVSFLSSKAERLQFIKALYDSRGYTLRRRDTNRSAVIVRPMNPVLADFIISTLRENGFTPKKRAHGLVALPTRETERFMRTIGFNKKV